MKSLVYSAVALLGCVSCVADGKPRDGGPVKATQPDKASLQQRAERYWAARVAQDWSTVFLFQDPLEMEGVEKAAFVAWCEKDEPFRIHAYQFEEFQTAGELGWAKVQYRTTLNRFPSMPPQEVTTWEKWRVVQNQWYPLPPKEYTEYPEPPARRNAEDEKRLRARFEEAWQACHTSDWQRLYKLCDPRDVEEIPEDEFGAVQGRIAYRDYKLQWVEAIGDNGRVRAAYEHKLVDENLTKLPFQWVIRTEDWIKYEGDWYRDLIRK